jgi:hypothetical protein
MEYKDPRSFRWVLIKKAVVFQLKLGADAIRDFILSPIAMILVVVDIILGHHQDQSYFFKMMKYGRLSDHWINLFDTKQGFGFAKKKNVDHWISQVESIISEQESTGKMSQAAKIKIDLYLDKISRNKS